MVPQVTALYAALLALVFLALSAGTIMARRGAMVVVGTGDDRKLLRASRAHANFAEYVPLLLVLMALAEATGAATWLLHLLGIALLVGRVSHAYGIRQEPEPLIFRQIGMMLTFTVMVVLALLCLFGALR